MTQPLFLRLALIFASIACLASLPAAAGAVEPVEINDVFDFKGTVTDIGVQRGPGQVGGIEYRVEGKFDYAGTLDLTTSTITFHNLFDEYLKGVQVGDEVLDGNGEMVLNTDNVTLVCPVDPPTAGCVAQLPPLVSSSSSKRIEAKYETQSRFRPPMRVQIKNKEGEYQFNVRLDRGTSPQVLPKGSLPTDRQFPHLCDIDPLSKSKRPVTTIRTSFTIDDGENPPVRIDISKIWECDPPGRYHLRSR